MSVAHRTAGRVCFWTSAVQEALLYQVAAYYDISRSAAVELLVREALDARMAQSTPESLQLRTSCETFCQRHPLAAAREMARREVDKVLRDQQRGV